MSARPGDGHGRRGYPQAQLPQKTDAERVGLLCTGLPHAVAASSLAGVPLLSGGEVLLLGALVAAVGSRTIAGDYRCAFARPLSGAAGSSLLAPAFWMS